MALVTKSPSFLSAEGLRERIRVRLMLAAGISAACFSATLWMTFRSTDWAHWIPSARDAWTALLPLLVVAGCAGAITLSRAVRTRTEESCIAWSALSGMVCFAALQSFRIFTPGWVLPSALEMLAVSLLCVVVGSVLGLAFGVLLLVALLNPCMPMLDDPAHDAPARASLVASLQLLIASLIPLMCRGLFRPHLLLLPALLLLIGALVFFILGWRERAAWRALRGELLRGANPSLALSSASVDAATLPLTAEDSGDGTKRAVAALGVTAYRDNAPQELAYVRIAEGAK